MKELIIQTRNNIFHFFYTKVVKQIFFKIDPEKVHDKMMDNGILLGSNPITKALTSLAFNYSNPALNQSILGINFPNPIGLAAGFDKNAQLHQILPAVGFGFAELGSITGEYCEGNPKPRLWRMPKSKSLLVYYGLKNDGAETISKRIENTKFDIPMGISIAKTNCKETVDLDAGIADYVKAYKYFEDIGSYITINISCPNAFGGEPFTDPAKLDQLLSAIEVLPHNKPVFIKISPDLEDSQIDEIINVVSKYKIDGFIAANLTKKRDNPKIKEESPSDKGGISGKVQEELANKLIEYLYTNTHGKYVIIGCGGVFNAEDAYKKIKSGASLIQMITGMIFEGPQVISTINQGLVKLLKADGYTNISQAIGVKFKNQ